MRALEIKPSGRAGHGQSEKLATRVVLSPNGLNLIRSSFFAQIG